MRRWEQLFKLRDDTRRCRGMLQRLLVGRCLARPRLDTAGDCERAGKVGRTVHRRDLSFVFSHFSLSTAACLPRRFPRPLTVSLQCRCGCPQKLKTQSIVNETSHLSGLPAETTYGQSPIAPGLPPGAIMPPRPRRPGLPREPLRLQTLQTSFDAFKGREHPSQSAVQGYP